MKIGVLGTGMVGNTIASKLVALGHDVRMGSRTKGNEKAVAWASEAGERASEGTFADAAAFGEMVFNCTSGAHTMAVLEAAGAEALEGKILVDISNPLDFSNGFPPHLFTAGTDSLGEQIQEAHPEAKVVKTLNTVSAPVMVAPKSVAGGEHTLFVCGNDAEAKQRVSGLLTEWFGWSDVLDLGDISMSRGTEGYLPLWVRLFGTLQSPMFSIKVVR